MIGDCPILGFFVRSTNSSGKLCGLVTDVTVSIAFQIPIFI